MESRIKAALERLVELKEHKDKQGKTYFYKVNKDAAWAEAKLALEEQK